MTVDELPGYLKQHWPAIREQLMSGTCQPQPVKRVEIPKPDGGIRNLGIPRPADPAGGTAGSAAKLGPDVFRQQFRIPAGAIAAWGGTQAQEYIAEGYGWVVDMDLEKFFDRVNHDKLMARIAKRAEDKRLLKLIRAFLNAGVMEDGLTRDHRAGSPPSPHRRRYEGVLLIALRRLAFF